VSWFIFLSFYHCIKSCYNLRRSSPMHCAWVA
jgi:hypothetical protein